MKTDLLALYGAVVGTIAILLQMRQSWIDRAILKVEGKLNRIPVHDQLLNLLNVVVVNNGRRPIHIRSVVVYLGTRYDATLKALPLVRDAETRKAYKGYSESYTLILFGQPGEQAIQLSPDGGQHTWEFHLPIDLFLQTHTKGEWEYGKAYVEITSGKKIPFTFPIIGLFPSKTKTS